MIWIIFILMTAAVLAIMLVPLLGTRPIAQARVVYDMVVYKDQLAEVDRDLERGVLSPDQAGTARTEIQRRMLAAAGEAQAAGKTKAVPTRRITAAAIAILVTVPGVGFGLYSLLGSPTLDGLWFLSRSPMALPPAILQEFRAVAAGAGFDLSQLVAVDQSHNLVHAP